MLILSRTKLNQGTPSGIPFVSLTERGFAFATNWGHLLRKRKSTSLDTITWLFWFIFYRYFLICALFSPARITVPIPDPALAGSNQKKRKLIIDSRRSQPKAATLPSLPLLDGLSSENMSAAVTNLSDEVAYGRQNHMNVSMPLYLYVPVVVSHFFP